VAIYISSAMYYVPHSQAGPSDLSLQAPCVVLSLADNIMLGSGPTGPWLLLGAVHWFWIFKLTGHVHCIGWRPLGTAQPCLHVNASYILCGGRTEHETNFQTVLLYALVWLQAVKQFHRL